MSDDRLHLAFSPCPNDTFTFYGWVSGRTPGPPVRVTFADVDVTNGATAQGAYDVAKVSYAALPWLLDRYRLLPCGGALGTGVGPLVLTRDGRPAAALSGGTLAVPGERTTAYLLARLWAAQQVPGGLGRVEVLRYDEIMPAVRDGRVDAGLVIHESRFTYPSFGLQRLADLGDWWEDDTGLPIPLGAIVARRELDAEALTETIRASVDDAWANPGRSRVFTLVHAQETDPAVVQQHIDLYVTPYTRDLGDLGRRAVVALLGRAAEEGLVPAVDPLS